ncbi:hypothetical protein [Methylobrevis pamukkalensis]|uniref:Uncharacterized protein n=1 Tax=Methylobrevis pamukkalensis TaxID=1439726 RepID=A0A1E3H3E5_9HYPH|nr:hypothetical protein [Methylobrevis pamukkalensis]ODN70867.1 hypothetical protein A6302_01784 [Methylobrevis pamukkalensis]
MRPIPIEIDGRAVAVARPEAEGFRFVAVKFDVWDLDGHAFATVAAAREAAAKLTSVGRPAARAA